MKHCRAAKVALPGFAIQPREGFCYELAMSDSPPLVHRAEPPLLERARRTGWALLVLALLAMMGARFGAQDWSGVLAGVAVALSIAGMLAVINVALVRSLYKQIDAAPPPEV